MKFSDFLTYSKSAPPPEPPVQIPSPPPPPPLKTPKASPASSAPSPALQAAAIEKKIREELQTQFQQEMDKARRELESYFRDQLDSEKKRLSREEENLKYLKQAGELEKEKIEQDKNRELAEYKKQLENSLLTTFETEKNKLKATFEVELQKSHHALEQFQKLLEIREKELSEAKKKLEVLIQPSDHMSAPPPPSTSPLPQRFPLPPPPPPLDMKPKESLVPPKMEVPLPPLPVSPAVTAASALKPIEKKEEKIPLVVFHEDSQAEELARKLRDQMIQLGEEIFEQAAHNHPLDITKLKGLLHSFIAMIQKRDLEAMRIALEPYPETHHFTYHCVNTAILSLILGLEFSFSNDEMMNLGLAAFLHDVGLVNVREDLNYPKKLTPQLETAILNHPIKGAEILRDKLHHTVVEAIEQHHEIGNGKGYPKGLTEKEIHLFSSILHVVDSFEALIHERPYRRKPLEVNEAMKQLIDTGRGVYDRNVLKALMVRVGLYPVMSYVELSNKQIARVVLQNRQYPLSPVVQMEYDENGNKLNKVMLVDLSQSQFIHILGPMKKETSSEHSTASRFASTEAAPESAKEAKKSETADFIQHAISVFLILTVVVILIYVVIKV